MVASVSCKQAGQWLALIAWQVLIEWHRCAHGQKIWAKGTPTPKYPTSLGTLKCFSTWPEYLLHADGQQ